MAVTVSLYNQYSRDVQNGSHIAGNTYKVALLNASGTFNAANTVWSDVSANEVSGNGWAAGGETLENVAITTVTTNDSKFDADDISVAATGGAIGPAENAVIYDASDAGSLMAHISFGEAKTADVGTDFKITWNAGGILTGTVT